MPLAIRRTGRGYRQFVSLQVLGAKQPHLTGPSECDPHHELLNLVQRCGLPIAFPVKAVTEEIPPNPARPPVLSTSHFWKLGSRTQRRKLSNPVRLILDVGPEFGTKGDDESTRATFTQSRKNGEQGVIGYRPTSLPIRPAPSAGANTPPHTAWTQTSRICSKMCSEVTSAQEATIELAKNINQYQEVTRTIWRRGRASRPASYRSTSLIFLTL